MNFKKGLLAFCLVMCILFCISSVSAEDLNVTATASDEVNDDTLAADIIDDNKVNTENENQIESTDDNATYLADAEESALSNPTINAEITPLVTQGDYKGGRATFQLWDTDNNVPLSNATVVLSIPGTITSSYSEKTDSNGIATYNFEDLYLYSQVDGAISINVLPVGTYDINVKVGDSGIIAQQVQTTLTVNKATLKITVTNVTDYYGTDKKLTIKVTNAATGVPLKDETFRTYISNTKDQYYYTGTGSSGIMTFSVNTLSPGIYEVETSPNQTSNVNSVSAKGKITIKGKGKITLSQSGTGVKTLTVKVVSTTTNQAFNGQIVKIKFSNGKTVTVKTKSDGIAKFKITFKSGTYWAKATATHSYYTFNSPKLSNIKIGKQAVTVKPKKLTTTYKSGKYFQAKVIDSKTKKPVKGVAIAMKIYTGKKAKTVSLTSNAKGIVKYSSSKVGIGTHKVVLKVKTSKKFTGKSATSYIKVGKQKVVIDTFKLTTTYKSGEYLKALVKNTNTNKGVRGVAVILTIDGKSVAVKTDVHGIVKYSSSKLGVGTHKVVMKVKSKYYAGNAKTTYIIIAKKKSSSNSGSHSNTPKVKLHTKLTVKECYRVDYTQYYFKVILKDSKGHAVANRNIIIETEIIVSGAPGMTVSHYATTNSKGVAEGYIRPIVNGAVEYDATFKFEGDKSYYSSSAHKYAG